MMRNHKNLTFVIAVLILMMCSCINRGNVSYSSFQNIPSDNWNYLDGRQFEPFVEDSTLHSGYYDVVLCIRHNSSYPYHQLWIEYETPDNNGAMKTDTIALKITDNAGRFIGIGRYDLYEVTDTLLKNIQLHKNWSLGVRPIMNNKSVTGVNKIGLILLKK